MAYFIEEAPARIEQLWGGVADGILGNVLFEGRSVIVDSREGWMRFGVSQVPSTAAP